MWKGWHFKISCWAYVFVSSTIGCIKPIQKIISNAHITFSSAMLNWGPYTPQNVSPQMGNDPIFCNKNVFGTSPNPMFVFFFLFTTTTITNHMASWHYLLTYGAEIFLRTCQLCSPSRIPQHFMEPEGSIPCSQEPSTGPYPEPYQSNPLHPIISL
jgi:hypothetical protein